MEERTKVFSKELIDLIRPDEYVARRYHETLDEVPCLAGEEKQEARRREMFYLNINWVILVME